MNSATSHLLDQLGDPATLPTERLWSLVTTLQRMRGKMSYSDSEIDAKLQQIFASLEKRDK